MSIATHTNCLRRLGFALALLALAESLSGCVERRMTVRSNPPGAEVYVDDYQIGSAPASANYTYYGTRKIRLVKDGYETLTVYQPMPAPWYDWPGIDFFSENFWPGKIRDERAFDYQMSPLIMVPTEELKSRADQLRTASIMQTAAETPVVTAPPATVAPAIGPPAMAAPAIETPQITSQAAGGAPALNANPQALPPINGAPTLIPPGNYPPPGGYPAPNAYPAPSALPPPPAAPPTSGPLFNQPVVPPGWRPIGEATTPLQR
ncbi:MAG TPA: PEGA domain-containing protein [Pirellulales bacterium]|nr:PEGA domain-containing protein [Pirellulales bacterium]